MNTINKAGHKLAQPQLLVRYRTGGIRGPISSQTISLPELYQVLLTEQQVETKSLYEPWRPEASDWELQQQRIHVRSTFPRMLMAGDADPDPGPNGTGDVWTWPAPLGLVVLSFRYECVELDAPATIINRIRLQEQILAAPLLGPSVQLICRGFEEECLLHVLVAIGPMKSYSARQSWINNILEANYPELRRRLCIAGVVCAIKTYVIGFDPLAWVRPPQTEGYILFPTRQAELKRSKATRKQPEVRNTKK